MLLSYILTSQSSNTCFSEQSVLQLLEEQPTILPITTPFDGASYNCTRWMKLLEYTRLCLLYCSLHWLLFEPNLFHRCMHRYQVAQFFYTRPLQNTTLLHPSIPHHQTHAMQNYAVAHLPHCPGGPWRALSRVSHKEAMDQWLQRTFVQETDQVTGNSNRNNDCSEHLVGVVYVCKLMSLNVANEEATELTSEQDNFLKTTFSVFLCPSQASW